MDSYEQRQGKAMTWSRVAQACWRQHSRRIKAEGIPLNHHRVKGFWASAATISQGMLLVYEVIG